MIIASISPLQYIETTKKHTIEHHCLVGMKTDRERLVKNDLTLIMDLITNRSIDVACECVSPKNIVGTHTEYNLGLVVLLWTNECTIRLRGSIVLILCDAQGLLYDNIHMLEVPTKPPLRESPLYHLNCCFGNSFIKKSLQFCNSKARLSDKTSKSVIDMYKGC